MRRIQDNPDSWSFISLALDGGLLEMDRSKSARSFDPEADAVGALREKGD
jgi:hypothetical protein